MIGTSELKVIVSLSSIFKRALKWHTLYKVRISMKIALKEEKRICVISVSDLDNPLIFRNFSWLVWITNHRVVLGFIDNAKKSLSNRINGLFLLLKLSITTMRFVKLELHQCFYD